MLIVLGKPLSADVIIALFFKAIKETNCEHIWVPEKFEIQIKNDGHLKKMGVVARKKDKYGRPYLVCITLEPLYYTDESFVTITNKNINVLFTTGKQGTRFYRKAEHPKGFFNWLLYRKDFGKIVAKFQEFLVAPIDSIVLMQAEKKSKI